MKNESVSILPMSYEEHLTIYSLDFEEFLWARNVPQESVDKVKDCIHRHHPLNDFLMKEMNRHFKDYMIVGGMPEAVQVFVDKDGDYMVSGRRLETRSSPVSWISRIIRTRLRRRESRTASSSSR